MEHKIYCSVYQFTWTLRSCTATRMNTVPVWCWEMYIDCVPYRRSRNVARRSESISRSRAPPSPSRREPAYWVTSAEGMLGALVITLIPSLHWLLSPWRLLVGHCVVATVLDVQPGIHKTQTFRALYCGPCRETNRFAIRQSNTWIDLRSLCH